MTQTAGPTKLIVLIGPTAVGKTNLSLHLAARFQCEIISGDSMQIYKGMDIGTAKATLAERKAVPHHLIDTHEPDEPFSVADFQYEARKAINHIASRGKQPMIVGGTGLYIESVCYDFQFSEGGSDQPFRQEMDAYADRYGVTALHDKLREIDPVSAERIHPNDRRRVIRALEIERLTGKPMSDHLQKQTRQALYDLCLIGLTMERSLLYKRIEQRIDAMLEEGLVKEVRGLLDRGYTKDLVSMQGLGYKEIIDYLQGEYTYQETVELLKRNTRRFAKRQLSWFRHMDGIKWVDVSEPANFNDYLDKISDIIAGKFHMNKEYITEQR